MLEGVRVGHQAWEVDAACVHVGGARRAGRSDAARHGTLDDREVAHGLSAQGSSSFVRALTGASPGRWPWEDGGPGPEGLRKGEEKMSTDQPTEARNAYRNTMAPVQKAYDEARDQARKAYDEANAAAGKAYDEAMAPAHKAYRDPVPTVSPD